MSGIGKSEKPIISSFTRVWLQKGRARPDHAPEFMSYMKIGSLNEGFGGITSIYAPDPKRYREFIEIGSYSDAKERPSTSLIGRYAAFVKSTLMDLAKKGCAFDVQVHIGECEDASLFNEFGKIIIFEGASIETYSTEDVGALDPGEQSKVDETGDISAIAMYEFVPLSFAERTPAVVTNQLLDVIRADKVSCGDCDDESDGSEKFFAVSKAAGGSGSTPADVVFTVDGGLNWNAHDVDSLGVADDPTALAAVSGYVIVTTNDGAGYHIALISEFLNSGDPSFSQVLTGFVAGGEPNDIWSVGSKAFIVGDGGYIYTTDDPSAGVTVIDAGQATVAQLNAVHAISNDFAVAVGQDGVIVVIESDLATLVADPPIGIGTHFNCVWVKTEKEWILGTSSGVLYYTLDAGVTWTTKSLPGNAPSTVTDVQMSSNSVMYVSGVVASKGRIYISVNGGFSFIIASRATNAIPACDEVTAIATSEDDIDFVVGVGLADDGADGYIVVGSD